MLPEPALPSSEPLRGRLALLFDLLTDAVRDVAPGQGAPALLDCGGGSGTFAVPLAVGGADVTVLDISADALATLRRRADEAGTASRVHPLAGDVEALVDLTDPAGPLRPGAFDLVLAHGILEAVDDPSALVAAMAGLVRPGGLLSILVGNPAAGVLARALAGEPAAALRELDRLASARVSPESVDVACTLAGLVVEARHGVGVFSDIVPGWSLDASGAREAVARLDAAAASRSPFADLAGRVHLRVRRPAG